VATLFCAAAFKLLRPNPKHLYCCLSYPPAWLAAIIGTLSVAVFDVSCGLALTGYRATLVDWVLYGAVPFGLTAIYYSEPTAIISFVRAWTSGWFCQAKSESVSLTRNDGSSSKPDGEDQIPWAQVEAWLEAERPAQHDFFHRLPIAQRLNTLIDEGVRSIGLVGPFGSGKSSIIEWLLNDLRTNSKFIVIKHSCWGFETSESAIRDILDSAVGEISQTVDTFDIASLPETYRNTFSSAGVAASSFSVILLSRKDPIQQLWDLDQILMNLGKVFWS